MCVFPHTHHPHPTLPVLLDETYRSVPAYPVTRPSSHSASALSKSATHRVPSSSLRRRMLAGFRSRCATQESSCRYAIADATWARSSMVSLRVVV